jgi:arylsulfatase
MLPIRATVFSLSLFLAASAASAADAYEPRLDSADRIEVYKTTPQKELIVNVFEGQDGSPGKHPAIVFFYGGGWVKGTTAHFQEQARFFSERGYTVFLPDYRVLRRDGTRVHHALEDAADAYAWVLENAERFNVDPECVVLAGGSAGGHLALSIPLLRPDLPLPAALVAFNPVTDTTPAGYHTPGAFEKPEHVAQFSLHDKIRSDLPPLLIMHGDADQTVPVKNARDFAASWEAHGNEARLVIYPGAGHGFFNGGEGYRATLRETEDFLEKTLPSEAGAKAAMPETNAGRPPNILIILVDDMGYSDPGFLGGDIETPHLDRLAAAGTVFGRFTNHSKCEPSRASLMTGVHFQRQTHDHVTREFGNVTTIAERLRKAGYRTLATGKWHLPGKPTEHGFDRFFGLRGGASNHFDPTGRLELDPDLYLNRELLLDGEPYTVENDDFYTTKAFTDYALRFLEETAPDEPFFLYLAYTAPHWPLQAPEEAIEKYLGRYDAGWESLRKERYENMRDSGFLPADWPLPEPAEGAPSWEEADNPRDAARAMAVHAAMMDYMDQQIGRVLNFLEQEGRIENTLILFTSDNGAAGVSGPEGRFDLTPEVPAGPVHSFRLLPEGFIYAANSPFRGHKLMHLSGGNTSPLIAYWPGKVPGGRVSWTPIDILDLMPTALQLGGGSYPDDLMPMDGRDRTALLFGDEVDDEAADSFFRLVYVEADERALLNGHWKVYRSGDADWQLFDLRADGTESGDRSALHPERADAMIRRYNDFENSLETLKQK